MTFSETMRDGVIRDPVVNHPNGGNRTCDGTGRYSDMVEGESIVIRNAHGEVVGIGQLVPGATTFRETSATRRRLARTAATGSSRAACRSAPGRGWRLRFLHRRDRRPRPAGTREAFRAGVNGAEAQRVIRARLAPPLVTDLTTDVDGSWALSGFFAARQSRISFKREFSSVPFSMRFWSWGLKHGPRVRELDSVDEQAPSAIESDRTQRAATATRTIGSCRGIPSVRPRQKLAGSRCPIAPSLGVGA